MAKALEIKGSRELAARLKKDVAKLKGSIQKTHQNLVFRMFRDLVIHTPQWSGTLAAHWSIEFHGHKAPPASKGLRWEDWKKDYLAKGVEPYVMGDDPTVTMTVAREMAKIPEIRYNSIVKFVNRMPYASNVQAGEGPYSAKLGDYLEIRDANKLYGKVAMNAYIDAKYRNKRELNRALDKPRKL